MIEKNYKMNFWFIDCMFCITIQREKQIFSKKYVKIGKYQQKFDKKEEKVEEYA